MELMSRRKKITNDSSEIQSYINEIMREKININAFIKEELDQYNVKNTIDTYCPVCGSDNVNISTKQTRSIDEAATNFYKCIDCGYFSKKFLHDDGTKEFKDKINNLRKSKNKSQ